MRNYFWKLDDIELTSYQEQHKEIVDVNVGNGDLFFLIFKWRKKYVGVVTLCGINQKNQRTSSSICIIPEARGRNIGPRAIQFVYSYAKEFLNCDTFFTCVSIGNIASARMMYKAGLK